MDGLATPPGASSSSPKDQRRSLADSARVKVNGLRTAVLGYLSEAEETLKARVKGKAPARPGRVSPSPPISTDSSTGESSAASPAPRSAGLRQRTAAASNPSASRSPDPTLLLDHLTQLRVDIDTHLSPNTGSPRDGPGAGFLRSLPHKLSVLDLGLTAPQELPDESSDEETVFSDPGQPVQGSNGVTPIDTARSTVIQMAKSLLPNEDWQGWERLGWEDEGAIQAREARKRLQRRWSYQDPEQVEDEDAPPEYLFPNRTPASNVALAQGRAARSRSVGSHDQAPPMRRFFSAPQVQYSGISSMLAAEDETTALLTPNLMQEVGPTVQESLERSHGGRKLIEYDDLPIYWRNNDYVVTG